MENRMSPVALTPAPAAKAQGFRLTGRMVLAILLGWFAIVGSVNAIMMTLAVKTLPATVVSSSYKVGNAYNHELAAARAQNERHWNVDLGVDHRADGVTAVSMTASDKDGKVLPASLFRMSALRPVDGRQVIDIPLTQGSAGEIKGETRALERGLWELTLEAYDASGERLFLSLSRVVLK
jgi:nitrogen fixation protein FixH